MLPAKRSKRWGMRHLLAPRTTETNQPNHLGNIQYPMRPCVKDLTRRGMKDAYLELKTCHSAQPGAPTRREGNKVRHS